MEPNRTGTGFPRVAVVGAGAVGSWFGGRLAAAGVDVTLVGRPTHVEAIARDGLVIESAGGAETIRARATTEMSGARDAGLVLLCVKAIDTEEVARALVPHVGTEVTVLSLQNGIDNVERMARVAPSLRAFPAVVYVAVAMAGPGRVRHTGRGDLVIGDLAPERPAEHRARLDEAARTFGHAGVACTVSDRIEVDLWAKMVMNCAYNAVSALTGLRYGAMIEDPNARQWMGQAALETVAVAHASGVTLEETAMLDAMWRLAGAMPQATSSTAQDLALGRPTEIESLNGWVARAGERLGVPTPINTMLAERVRQASRSIFMRFGTP